MSLLLDTRYFLELTPKLDGFKKVQSDLYNFRCPFCGDSKHSQTKARGYMYTFKGADGLIYKCHNCGYSTNFRNFLKEISPQIYRRYLVDLMKEQGFNSFSSKKEEEKRKLFEMFRTKETIIPEFEDSIFKDCQRLDKMDANHPCKAYVVSRKIPVKYYPYLYFTDDFTKFVNNIIPNKLKGHNKEGRLIIPFFDKHGRCYAFIGRSLDPESKVKYITIKLNEDAPRIFGLDRVDYGKKIYCCEGQIDSMFLPNAIAVSGSCYDDPLLDQIKPNVVIVPDNERRNREVANNIRKMVDRGFKVCLWRDGLGFKDINEAILNGYSVEDLVKIINEDTVQGIVAKVKFKIWTKV